MRRNFDEESHRYPSNSYSSSYSNSYSNSNSNSKSFLTPTRLFLLLLPFILIPLAYFEIRRSQPEFNKIAGLKEIKEVADNGLEFPDEAVVVIECEQQPFDLTHLPSLDLTVNTSSTALNPPVIDEQSFPIPLLRTGHHRPIPDLIVNKQLALDEVDSHTGWTLLHYLARSTSHRALKWLLSNCPCDVNTRSNNVPLEEINPRSPQPHDNESGHIFGGDTPLHLAVTHPNRLFALLFTHLLLQFNASPDIPNAAMQTARQLAANRPNFAELLEVLDGTFNPQTEYKSDTKTYVDFAFGPSGPPSDPYFWY